jgi:phosphoribosylformylglycinamidine synthase
MSFVHRIFVEKKPGFDVAARSLLQDLKSNLGVSGLEGVRLLIRYDVAGLTNEEYQTARNTIFAEPPVDYVYDEQVPIAKGETVFAIEYLPGQYDQRADSAAQCIQVITHKQPPAVNAAQVLVLRGKLSKKDLAAIKKYCINPVDSREASLDKPTSLEMTIETPADVAVLDGFNKLDPAALEKLRQDLGLAMKSEDIIFCRDYFRDTEKRNPTLTEIRVLDTYWSDHCRHTTFLTTLDKIEVEAGRYTQPINEALNEYESVRERLYGVRKKERCLMDIALLAMKELRRQGKLEDLEESEEINACSIRVKARVNGRNENWLVMFKNETHNHPTEIEPFGGAATCLGGAIRDPLSGRSYVYQAMRVTGAGDPRKKIEETIPGKLPQRKITVGAAHGYSSYGNQIGLSTGMVTEIYDEGYVAKRMEIGAVIAAAPQSHVIRETPATGDVVVLLGGRTGRDGCGGATGSSKEHTEHSIATCSAEVQKGNPPTERKIQRLFRNPKVSRMIKKCNDFGAGGVSVAIGELAAGLDINLDAVPKKYEGLDGTELAISESQERMAVVLAPADVERFIEFSHQENLEATPVATVTANHRLRMKWRGKTIVDIHRDFIDTNGVRQKSTALITAPDESQAFFQSLIPAVKKCRKDLRRAWLTNLSNLNVCSQRGMVERFDSTIGAGSVLMPFGGRTQNSPAECMVAKLPVRNGDTLTGTIMSHGFTPTLSLWSPFHGAVYAIVESLSKIAAVGGDTRTARLTLQEYFEKLGDDPKKWGKPASALLGAFFAQLKLGVPAIGGKDSMSGSFKQMSVPPTLVSFAVSPVDVSQVISSAFTQADSHLVFLPLKRDAVELPDFTYLDNLYQSVQQAIRKGQVRSAGVVRIGGLAATLSKMCFGNQLGVALKNQENQDSWFTPNIGSLVLELDAKTDISKALPGIEYQVLGRTVAKPVIRIGQVVVKLEDAFTAWSTPLDSVFPQQGSVAATGKIPPAFAAKKVLKPAAKIAKPRVLITVFPGTNCEYDTARAFERAGAVTDIFVMKNLFPQDVDESIRSLVQKITKSQIVVLPGGFSAGDEPEGSGKFIAAVFRNGRVKDAVHTMLGQRDGLMLGICNGFQALIKLGLVPHGEIRDMDPESPTLTFNTIGRHISRMIRTKVYSTLSPWLSLSHVNDVHMLPVSHGEGRFVAGEKTIKQLFKAGQVATLYVDEKGKPTNDPDSNPNGSLYCIEGITSPDGRVFGKMGHTERTGVNIFKNIPGKNDQPLFESGVAYFR